MGAGVVGGFLFSAVAGEQVPVVVPVVIGALSLLAAGLAIVPVVQHGLRPFASGEPWPGHQGS